MVTAIPNLSTIPRSSDGRPSAGLTPRQRETLRFIADFQRANRGKSPSYTEIGIALRGISRPAVFYHVAALERAQAIERDPHASRYIRITDIGRTLLRRRS